MIFSRLARIRSHLELGNVCHLWARAQDLVLQQQYSARKKLFFFDAVMTLV